MDTRNAGGTIPSGTARGFRAWGTSFAAQGGSATSCGIPQNTNIAALDINMVVVGTAADGYITAYPYGPLTPPNASTLNYLAGAVLANGATVKVSQTSLAFDWNLFTSATTHFVADVVGYYSKPVATALDCTAVSDGNTTVPASIALQSVTAPFCDAGYSKTATSCSFFGTQLVVRRTETSSLDATGATSSCTYDNPAPTAQNVFITSTCCRIPGR